MNRFTLAIMTTAIVAISVGPGSFQMSTKEAVLSLTAAAPSASGQPARRLASQQLTTEARLARRVASQPPVTTLQIARRIAEATR